MIIECESCRRKFRLDDSRIKPPGSSVRCSKCGHIFFVSKTEDYADQDLVTSKKTPLFEDLEEEVAVEKTELNDVTSEKIQAELDSIASNDEELVDLPTEHQQDIEDYIDRQTEEQNTDIEFEESDDLPVEEEDFNSVESDTEKDVTGIAPDPSDLFEDIEAEEIADDIEGKDIIIEPEQEEYLEEGTKIHKTRTSIFTRIIYTLITIAALFVIFIACILILINAEILPKGTLSGLTTVVESIIPIELNNTEVPKIIITEHKGRWMNTVNGPIYIVSGLITNESETPVHYVEIKSEFIAGDKLQYSNNFYAGNTFTDKELKVTPIEKTLSKLKQKNGDIDVDNPRKLVGLNYNIQPGESIPFFSVFPSDGRMLGLRYNLQIIDYEESSTN